MKKWIVWNAVDEAKAEIIMSGYFGSDDKVNYAEFQTACNEIVAAGIKYCTLKINSCGGDMTEGLAIIDAASESGLIFDVQVIGVAASMGAIGAYIGSELPSASANARIMFHRPQVGAYGESSLLRSRADLADGLETTIKQILVKKTGKPEATVNEWFQAGKEMWFTAEEALAAGIISKIVKAGEAAPAVDFPVEDLSEATVWNRVYNTIQLSNTSMKYTTEFKAKLKLPANATDAEVEQVLADLQEKASKVDQLQSDMDKQKSDRAKALVNDAISAGKITEADRKQYEEQAVTNYDFVANILGKVKAPLLPDGNIVPGNKSDAGAALDVNDRTKWTLTDWAKNDMDGLNNIRATNKAEYTAICKRSGVEPSWD